MKKINYEHLDEIDSPGHIGKIGKKNMKGRPVGSRTQYLSREVSRYNRTHNAVKGAK